MKLFNTIAFCCVFFSVVFCVEWQCPFNRSVTIETAYFYDWQGRTHFYFDGGFLALQNISHSANGYTCMDLIHLAWAPTRFEDGEYVIDCIPSSSLTPTLTSTVGTVWAMFKYLIRSLAGGVGKKEPVVDLNEAWSRVLTNLSAAQKTLLVWLGAVGLGAPRTFTAVTKEGASAKNLTILCDNDEIYFGVGVNNVTDFREIMDLGRGILPQKGLLLICSKILFQRRFPEGLSFITSIRTR